MPNDELIKRLREKAGAFDYDGRPDIACDYEQAADAIEQLSNAGSAYGRGWTLGYDAGREENKPHWISVKGSEGMGIYLPNMEMPESCPCELLGIGYDLYCSFAGGIPARVKEYYECCQNGTRPSWCPLVPVPPHGRLGDLDALEELVTKRKYECAGASAYGAISELHKSWGLHEAELMIEATPTIIPADHIGDATKMVNAEEGKHEP